MENLFRIRCRKCGIITTSEPEKHDFVWKRKFDPDKSPIDRKKLKSNFKNEYMKSTENFKTAIQKHLDQLAEKDTLFAETLKKPEKNINDCITYILNQVKASGCNGFADEEIFAMAVHYYDEDNIEVGKPINGNVVVNHHVELTEEEKTKAREKAIEEFKNQEKDSLIKNVAENIELSPEDLAEAKRLAIDKIAEEEKQKKIAKAAKKQAKSETKEKSEAPTAELKLF